MKIFKVLVTLIVALSLLALGAAAMACHEMSGMVWPESATFGEGD